MTTIRTSGADLHYVESGGGPPVLFVHGGVMNGQLTWAAQQPLAERWRVVLIDRPGFGPNPPVSRVDFATDADAVGRMIDRSRELWGVDRVHLVGHSYGGVVSLLAAAARPEGVRSLTVIEPPAFGIATGERAVEELVSRLKQHWERGPRDGEAAFLNQFLRLVGSATELPDPLPPALRRGAAMLVVERGPWEAQIPVATLARAPFPKLVVSGGHHAAFDAVCDVLERALGADRAVLPGAGHSVPRTGAPFNQRLVAFLTAAERR